jgi:metal-responsive CopG/Arc/MetJ family transcriptional regulator
MVRIQLDLPDERVKELDSLMDEVGVSTRKDLFNNALTLFEWAVDEKRAGRTIASIDDVEKRYKELVMPALETVTASASQEKARARVAPQSRKLVMTTPERGQ